MEFNDIELVWGLVPFLHSDASSRSLVRTATFVGAALLLILVVDTILVAGMMRMKLQTGERWFALHAVINFAITLTCLPDLALTLSNPGMCSF